MAPQNKPNKNPKKEDKKEAKGVTPSPPAAPAGISPNQELQQLYTTQFNAEVDVARLTRLLTAMETGEITEELLEVCPELVEVQQKNQKLKFRKTILERSVKTQEDENAKKGIKTAADGPSKGAPDAKKSKEESKGGKEEQKGGKGEKKEGDNNKNNKTPSAPPKAKKHDYVVVKDFAGSIMGRLAHVFKKAIKEAFPTVSVPLVLAEATNPKFGDYQCNSAMGISAALKAQGTAKRPAEVAADIVAKLPVCPLISKTEIPPAGFINVFLNEEFIAKQCGEISRHGVRLPTIESRRVIVDFSSPNIAKEMHVGHLRSTIIGDAISRLFEAIGFDVLRLNHIGDWGTQFGMLIAHLFDRFPNFQKETPAIGDLQSFYKESKKRFDEDAEFKKRAYECVVKLQSSQPEFIKAWNDICDVSRKSNNEVYDKLDIKLNERGESYYHNRMEAIVEELKTRSFLREEEGRHLMFPTGCDIPLTVVKSDGGFTYDTSDLAALKNRLFEENGDWLIYVVDAGQSLHFETIFSAGRDLGWYDEAVKRVEHVGFGLVLGEDKKKFKTRSGETVRLKDLLDEGVRRSEEKLKEKCRDRDMSEAELTAARDAVAYGGIKYADLSHTRTQDYIFSYDRMLDDKGNTAVYLLYAYARIRSIVRQSGVSQEEMDKYAASNELLPLGHPKEVKLAKQVLKLSDVILQVVDTLMLHTLCDYLYNLSTTFTEFYSECYVVEKLEGTSKVNMNRLLLAHVTANTMETALNILGIKPVPKM
ncbi:rars-1 [Pristionchus pacificus]|uniref:Probable arginine--tRNA ligase, cytoplasmic n=1 Tax=Pristionchus pacificus TaxID=54126 RepID=A0A454XR76_PRIPA|nr:rars-1 [Pristionchus pacificus]|eukprot:PDM63127.1 rars-1 [Pristionchus pacificus]